MILRSLKTFTLGYIFGVILGLTVKTLLPGLYLYIIYLLEKKTIAQTAVSGGYSRGILFNNILASFLCSYGGYFITRVFLKFKTPASPSITKLAFLEERINTLRENELKYFLSLFTLPFFILWFNGLILGFLLILYVSEPFSYFMGLLPHGVFELPAIILAGGIGYAIAEAVFNHTGDIKKELNARARKEAPRYLLVILLLVAGAYLEP